MTDLRTLKAGSGTVATDIFNAVIDAILGGLRFTASNVDSGAATDGQVLTADGAGGASWEAGGGSQPDTVYVLDYDFDTAGLTTGIDTGYVAAVGDVVVIVVSVPTAFNGTTPTISLYKSGANPWSEGADLIDVSVADGGPVAPGWNTPASSFGSTQLVASSAAALKAKLISNDDGGDPGSTAGSARIVLQVFHG